MIRVIHQFATLPEGLESEIVHLRELLEQAELYRTLANGDSDFAMALLASDEVAYGAVLAQLDQLPAYRSMLHAADSSTDIYEKSAYGLDDGLWIPVAKSESDSTSAKIVWPARGAVRILIQGAYEPNGEMHALTAAEIEETRREPGCVFYSWFENVELPNHLMLLETWTNQRIYDLHWSGRMNSVDYRGNSGRVATPPERGEASREFYREQQFEYQYGRMLPSDVSAYSESVVWES